MEDQNLQVMGRQQPSSLTNARSDVEEQILADWGKMLSTCSNREDCLFGNHPTLEEMNNDSKGSGFAAISKLLDLMNAYTNKVELSKLQNIQLSQEICVKFFYLKETEVMLFFNDYFKYASSNQFFGVIEPKTITTMLTKWVREKRGKAITNHDLLLKKQKREEEKPYLVTWEEFSREKEKDPSDSPLVKLLSSLGRREVPKDTPESISETALSLIENKWGYDDDAMMNARRSFAMRYGYSPEDYLRKEGKYV